MPQITATVVARLNEAETAIAEAHAKVDAYCTSWLEPDSPSKQDIADALLEMTITHIEITGGADVVTLLENALDREEELS